MFISAVFLDMAKNSISKLFWSWYVSIALRMFKTEQFATLTDSQLLFAE